MLQNMFYYRPKFDPFFTVNQSSLLEICENIKVFHKKNNFITVRALCNNSTASDTYARAYELSANP